MFTCDNSIKEGTGTELTDFDGCPDDCDCGDWNDGFELLCWPCYRRGRRIPSSRLSLLIIVGFHSRLSVTEPILYEGVN